MNQKRVFVLCVLLACFAAFLAFLFSSQPGKESVGMSRGILQWFAGLFGAELNSTSLKTWDFFFRKGAHFTLYFVLGFGLCGAFQRQKRMPPWVPALLLGAAFAVTDEFHQLFTQRTAMVQDVLLDSCGVAAGCGAACLVRWIGKKTAELMRFAGRLPKRGGLARF